MERNTQQACRYVQDTGYCPKLKSGHCPFRHPPQCKNNTQCWNTACTYLHDNELCRYGATCYNKKCMYRHPKEVKQQAQDAPAHVNNRDDRRHGHHNNQDVGRGLNNNNNDSDTRSEMSQSSRSDRDNRGTQPDRSDTSTKTNRSPLEELLADQRKFTMIYANVKAIAYVKRALSDFDALIKAAGKTAYRYTKMLEADNTQDDNSILSQQARQATAYYKELVVQRRTITYAIFGAIKALTGPSIPVNYFILRELNRLKEHLPILGKRYEIAEAVRKNSVVVIQGGSGSGKSSQLAQYFADMPDFAVKKIICSNPRRSGAITLAQHVQTQYSAGSKRYNEVGSFVGYRVFGAKKVSRWTRIEYITEDYLIHLLNPDKREQYDKPMKECGVVIIDEAQERNINTDVLFGVMKMLQINYPHLKIVVTSTTPADATLFSQYFDNCPIVSVPDRLHPIRLVHKAMPMEEDMIVGSVLKSAVDVLRSTKPNDADILCFVPSVEDAERAATAMQGFIAKQRVHCRALCLHENQSVEELQEVLAKPQGFRRVIFATSIAEASIALHNIRYVIDCGLSRREVWDPATKQNRSQLLPISKSSANLRRDLVGRNMPGTCFRLYNVEDFDTMPVTSTPELFRKALTLISASLMWMKINPVNFPWLEPPKRTSLESALQELALFKAVNKLPGGSFELTQIGQLVALLQMDPRMVHMLYNACKRGLGKTACVIAGLMSVATGVFWRSGDYASRKASDAARLKFTSPHGDIATLYRVYCAWVEQKNAKTTHFDTASSTGDDAMDIDDMGLNNYEARSNEGVNDVVEADIDNESDSSDESDSEASETKSQVSEVLEEPDLNEVESASSMQLEENSSMGDEDDGRVENKKAQARNVWKWCKENFINNKALMAAESLAADLRRGLIKYGAWNLSNSQDVQADEMTIQRMVFDASIMNLGVRIRDNVFQMIASKTIAAVTPLSSIILRGESLPKFVVYNNIMTAGRTFLVNITPAEAIWLKDFPEIEANINELNIEQVKVSPVPQTVLQAIAGRYNANLEELGKVLGCMVEADTENGALIAWCSPNRVQEIRQILEAKVERVSKKTRSEVHEEALIGGTRIVWGEGGEIITLLQEDEFISVTIGNLPATVTEEKLYEMVAAFSEPRSCKIIPSKDKNTVTGHVVFRDPTLATKFIIDHPAPKFESRDLHLVPGVVKKKLAVKSKGYLQISAALSKNTKKAVLIFANLEDARAFCLHREFAKRCYRKLDTQSDPTKPRKVTLALGGEDEVELINHIQIRNLPLPIHISVVREDIDQDTIGQTKKFISELDTILPEHVKENVVHKTVFFDEKIKRGGVRCYFNSFIGIDRAAEDSFVIEKLRTMPLFFGQLVRVQKFFSMSMAISTGIWTMFEADIRRAIKTQKSNVVAVISQKQHLIILDLQSQKTEYLNQLQKVIDHIIKCTIYTHPKKSFLFSSIGRKRLTNEKLPIEWDNTGTVRIYGANAQREKTEKRLNELIEQLLSMALNETFIIKRDSLKQVKIHLDHLQQVAGVEEVRLFGSRLVASGTKESVAKLRELMAQAIVVPKKAQERTEDECPICIDTYDEPVTLQSCGHTFCKACMQGYLAQTTLPVPLCCPLNCKPIVVKDLLALASPDVLEHVKQTAVEKFLLDHSNEFVHCPKTGCAQLMRLPPVSAPQDEKKAGGRVVSCDQCTQDYCYTCSNFYNSLIGKHTSFTCKENQAMLHPTIQQHVRFIQNELLVSSCPRCKKAFLDFNGCCAVTCQCGAGFCGLCLTDTNGDAHAHVYKCPWTPEGVAKGVFHTVIVIAQSQGAVKKKRLIEYLKQIGNIEDRKSVLQNIVRDLADLKIEIKENEIL